MTTRIGQLAARRQLAARLRLHAKALNWLGVAMAAAGVAIIAFPSAGLLILGAVAGWILWFVGAVMMLVALFVGQERSTLGALLTSLAAIGSGAFLLFNPTAGALAATLLIAAVLILDGAFELALALDLRPIAAWRWMLASSIASGLAGIILAAGAAGSRSLMATLLGLALASTGVALLALGRTRRAGRRRPSSLLQDSGVSRSPSTPST
jgi:uncharacterized membrane protein HdeD (DUF308 family)